MKTSSVSLILGLAVLLFGPTVSAVSLDVYPHRRLYFRGESVYLSCVENGQTVDGWTVKRTAGGQTQTCDGGQPDFGKIAGFFCIVSHLSLSDSGVYWCESRAGQRSVQVNVSVTAHSVILELPKLPVTAGSNVTLRCATKDTQTAYFFKNDTFIGYRDAGEFTISHVQQSDEGFYHCSTGLLSRSSRRWLSVTDSPPPPPPPPSPSPPPLPLPPPPPSLSVIRLLCHLVVAFPYCISTVLMVSICCGKRTGNKPAVSMEMDPRAEGGQGLSEEHEYVTEHDF